MKIYDYIIIGSGIAGLYTAFKLTDKYPNSKILILEKNKYVGGRILVKKFRNKYVPIGAGIGRYDKDIILKYLLTYFNIPIKSYVTKIDYNDFYPIDTLNRINTLKKVDLDLDKTFKQNYINFFGKKDYNIFRKSNGFTDFENADVIDTIYDYGFEDNTPGQNFFRVDWRLLIKCLYNTLKTRGVLFKKGENVKSVNGIYNQYILRTKNYKNISKTYIGSNIIYATGIDGVKSSYPFDNFFKNNILNAIKCNTFLRYYIKTNREISDIESYTFQNNFLQKTINMGNNIYMISYSDNKFANGIQKMNKRNFLKQLEKMYNIKIIDSFKHYWNCGTHYYTPLNREIWKDRDHFINTVQCYRKNIFIVGELISKNQGWVEGALESVENIFDKI